MKPMQRAGAPLFSLFLILLLAACAASPELLAKMEEYDRTVPICLSSQDCELKWQTAREWAIGNSDFPVLTEGELRIMASSTLIGMSGIGVIVNRDGTGTGSRILVDIECFSAYGCPDIWDLKLQFNQAIAAAQ